MNNTLCDARINTIVLEYTSMLFGKKREMKEIKRGRRRVRRVRRAGGRKRRRRRTGRREETKKTYPHLEYQLVRSRR